MIEIIALILLIVYSYIWYFHPHILRKHENKMTYAALIITIVTIIATIMVIANLAIGGLTHRVLPFID